MNNLMNNPLVSIIVPVYNGAKYLAETLTSILAQDYQPYEVIVIDDGSTDDSAAIIQRYPVRYIYQENQGVAQARNFGVSSAQGDYLAFLDQDDLWTKDKLSVQIAYMQTHNVGYTICHQATFLIPGIELPSWVKKEFLTEHIPSYLLGALVVRRAIWHQVGLLDPHYKHGNDADWFFRIQDLGIEKAILPQVLLHKRIHSSNQSYDIKTMQQELLQVARASLIRKRKQRDPS